MIQRWGIKSNINEITRVGCEMVNFTNAYSLIDFCYYVRINSWSFHSSYFRPCYLNIITDIQIDKVDKVNIRTNIDSTSVEWPSEPTKLRSLLLISWGLAHATAGTFGARDTVAIPERLGGSENRLISKYVGDIKGIAIDILN